MLRPFIYLTSYSVMFFLTEFALHTHLNAFGARTMTALYAAAMFINGCGYLLFPLLARTRMAAAGKHILVPAASRSQGRESSSRSPRWLWAASSAARRSGPRLSRCARPA